MRRPPVSRLAVLPLAVFAACGGSGTAGDAGDAVAQTGDAPATVDQAAPADASNRETAADAIPADADATDGAGGDAAVGPTAAQLLALTGQCANVVSSHPYAADEGATADIDICGLDSAVFWTADMDIDCDGRNVGDDKCPGDDCCYQAATAFTTKAGRYLAASVTPYVVIPTDFRPVGLVGGAVVAVIYGGKVQYAVFGDTGPDDIIGEASYACAAALGIDPDPASGGTDGPVTYIAFLGSDAVPADIEDQAATLTLGESLAAKLLQTH